MTRDVLTRLFTTYSLDPSETKRKGLVVSYAWEKELKPAESFVLESKTNYTFPLILLIIIVISFRIFLYISENGTHIYIYIFINITSNLLITFLSVFSYYKIFKSSDIIYLSYYVS